MLLEILQNSPQNTYDRVSFLIKLQAFFIKTPLVAASVFFQSILLALTNFSFWQETWALAYHSMIAVGFLRLKPALGGSKFSLSSF